MARTYKTVGFSIPPQMVDRIEETIKKRNMTKSELFREIFRAWEKQNARNTDRDTDSEEAIMEFFAKIKKEERKNPETEKVDKDFYRTIANDLQRRAKERGRVITEGGEILEKEKV